MRTAKVARRLWLACLALGILIAVFLLGFTGWSPKCVADKPAPFGPPTCLQLELLAL